MVGYRDPEGAIWGRESLSQRWATALTSWCGQPVVEPARRRCIEANSQPGFCRLRRPPHPPLLSSLRRLRRHPRPEARPRPSDHGPARGARYPHGKGRRALRRGERQARHHQGAHRPPTSARCSSRATTCRWPRPSCSSAWWPCTSSGRSSCSTLMLSTKSFTSMVDQLDMLHRWVRASPTWSTRSATTRPPSAPPRNHSSRPHRRQRS